MWALSHGLEWIIRLDCPYIWGVPGSASPVPPTVDRDASVPLWAQVQADLRRRCDEGDFDAGVPGELSLAAEYQVSRHTIREALRTLRSEGIVSSGRGRVSTVQTPFSQSLGMPYSLFRTVEQQGAEQSSDVLRLEFATSSGAARRLGLATDASLVVIERVRRADGTPIAHDVSWMPADIARSVLHADLTRTALYDELDRVGVHIDAGTERIQAIAADADTARLLQCSLGAPLLYLERLATSGGQPVEWRRAHVRGDQFTLENAWTPGPPIGR